MITELNTFDYNGKKLSELGAVIRQRPTYAIAVHDIKFESIPFLSGDVAIDNKKYKNITYKIPIRAVPSLCNLSAEDFTKKLSEWLDTGEYSVYRDTYNKGYFRYAIVTNIDPVVAVYKDVYESSITFSLKPFLYADSGTKALTKVSASNAVNMQLINPEQWDSEPIIKINGSGNFTVAVGNISITLTGVNNYIVIDKTKEDVYDGNGSCNDKLSGLYLPYLKKGVNNISITGDSSFSVDITPNWRRL